MRIAKIIGLTFLSVALTGLAVGGLGAIAMTTWTGIDRFSGDVVSYSAWCIAIAVPAVLVCKAIDRMRLGVPLFSLPKEVYEVTEKQINAIFDATSEQEQIVFFKLFWFCVGFGLLAGVLLFYLVANQLFLSAFDIWIQILLILLIWNTPIIITQFSRRFSVMRLYPHATFGAKLVALLLGWTGLILAAEEAASAGNLGAWSMFVSCLVPGVASLFVAGLSADMVGYALKGIAPANVVPNGSPK